MTKCSRPPLELPNIYGNGWYPASSKPPAAAFRQRQDLATMNQRIQGFEVQAIRKLRPWASAWSLCFFVTRWCHPRLYVLRFVTPMKYVYIIILLLLLLLLFIIIIYNIINKYIYIILNITYIYIYRLDHEISTINTSHWRYKPT